MFRTRIDCAEFMDISTTIGMGSVAIDIYYSPAVTANRDMDKNVGLGLIEMEGDKLFVVTTRQSSRKRAIYSLINIDSTPH